MMGNSNDLSVQIMQALAEYSTDLAMKVDRTSRKSANALRRELEAKSPEMTGDYKKNWKVKRASKSDIESRYIVYNDKEYRLTHLLEFGHAIKGGTERVKAIPHIAPAEAAAVEKYMKDLEKALKAEG